MFAYLIFIILHLCISSQSILTNHIDLINSTQQLLLIDNKLNYTYNISVSKQYIYVEIHSCYTPSFILAYNNTQIQAIKQLKSTNLLYKVNVGGMITFNLNNNEQVLQNYTIKIQGISNQDLFPTNSLDIQYSLSMDFFTITFSPLIIPNVNSTTNYSIWISNHKYGIQCSIYSNQLPENNEYGIIYLKNMTTNNSINLKIPLDGNQIENVNSNLVTFVNLQQIKNSIMIKGKFSLNVHVDGSTPYNYMFLYNKNQIKKISNDELEGAFAIFFAGVFIFIIVSCCYLYYKRKYKSQQKFEQELDVQIQDDTQVNKPVKLKQEPLAQGIEQNHQSGVTLDQQSKTL